ncbi:putative sugar O-methyltransferase [Bradyrhizobium sp. Ai1a-2]|uniref:putative sugar O-methyltransferase n=1 Tax=Bradyrhizobium sp. Ai1a-2 TaxID=196490 RepID=UPI0004830A0C|nr:putative sugar O-methyltransferase [Bradyrhizobium sp. Ai1a-2]
MWERDLATIKKEIHDALNGSNTEKAAMILRNPAETTFFWGFDAIAKAPPGAIEPHENVIKQLNKSENWEPLYSLWLMNGLTSVAEALGARRVPYPETDPHQVGVHEKTAQSTDQVLDQIEAALTVKLKFPNPFPGELGLASSRGIVGFRSIHAIYQAWRIAQLAKGRPDFRVMEIGAGLGRTAYFANIFGVKDYTIVDIPLSNAAQAYFLGRVLGPDCIRVSGEAGSAQINVMSASDIGPSAGRFDLIVNIDSWTEMSRDTAEAYWKFARSATNAVLSINHEHNGFTVRDLYSKDADVTARRFPYWTRRGYVEEYLTW